MLWAEDYELQTTALSRLTRIHSYAILCLHLYRAASSMAEQAPLKRKVQGSTPWQPTSVESAEHPRGCSADSYPILITFPCFLPPKMISYK